MHIDLSLLAMLLNFYFFFPEIPLNSPTYYSQNHFCVLELKLFSKPPILLKSMINYNSIVTLISPNSFQQQKISSTITINIDMGNNLLDCGIELVQTQVYNGLGNKTGALTINQFQVFII